MQAFGKIIENKTVIVIAHRLSTIVKSDQIIVLNRGKIQATGNHVELLETCELYQKMWDAHQRAKQFEITYN